MTRAQILLLTDGATERGPIKWMFTVDKARERWPGAIQPWRSLDPTPLEAVYSVRPRAAAASPRSPRERGLARNLGRAGANAPPRALDFEAMELGARFARELIR